MKALIFILFSLISLQGHSQCRKTFVYGFELTGISNPEWMTATVYYKGKALNSKSGVICEKSLKINKQFTYLKNSSKNLNGIKLPYKLQANRFYWLMTDDMTTEMAMYPDRFKIILDTKDENIKARYELPVSYDFISQNAIYLDLTDKSEANLQKEFNEKIWQFIIYEKESLPVMNDTVLIYSRREKIPEGILSRFPELKNAKNIHSVQEYQIAGMLFNHKIYLKVSENIFPKADEHTGLYISLDGKKCATSGGITGHGFGECAGANVSQNNRAIPYQINIQIEP